MARCVKISKVWASSGLLSPTITKIDNNYLLCKQCAIWGTGIYVRCECGYTLKFVEENTR